MEYRVNTLVRWYLGLGLLGLGMLPGCAIKMTAVPISETARKEFGYGTRGIPYYLPRPYLLVTRNVTLPPLPVAGDKTSPPDPTRVDTTATAAPGVSTDTPVQPRYQIQVIYLPDLSRQYALQQEGGFGNTALVYALQGGWMFTGLNVETQTKVPETISAVANGLSTVLGTSLEDILTHDMRMEEAGAGLSGVDDPMAEDISPRIWIFEISQTPAGVMFVDTKHPFFEWPTDEISPASPNGSGPDPGGNVPLPFPLFVPPTTPTQP